MVKDKWSGLWGFRPVCQICGNPSVYLDSRASYPSGSGQQLDQSHNAYIAFPTTANDHSWYIDSDAIDHITADLNNLSIKSDYKGKEK